MDAAQEYRRGTLRETTVTNMFSALRMPLVLLVVLSAFIAVLAIQAASYAQKKPVERLWLWQTKLHGISSGLMTYDKGLASNFRWYKNCDQIQACRTAFKDQRAIEVRRAWRQHFHLFLIDDNWATSPAAVADHSIFREKLEEVGAKRLREECVPVIVYETSMQGFGRLAWSGGVKHNFTGFDCPSASGSPGG